MTILLIVVLIVCLAAVVSIALKKLPSVQVVDPGTSKEVRAKEVKYALFAKRFERITTERARRFRTHVSGPLTRWAQSAIRNVAGRLTALEERYREREKTGEGMLQNPEVLRQMLTDADELMEKQDYDAAEKKLIAIVSHDPKYAAAYEHLARLYMYTKDLASAKETLAFLNKLTPRDASVLAALGEVAEARGLHVEALNYYRQALEVSPNNPKYLDFALSATITAGDVHEATSLLERLRNVNPDNQKIPLFAERIEEERQKKLGN